MSLTVTLVSSSTNCVDVRWSSSTTSFSLLHGSSQQSFYLVNVAHNDSAAGHEWTVVVRDSTTSALRFDLERSGIVGTPVVTVRRCHVTRSVHGDDHWTVEQVGKSSGSDDDPLMTLFNRLRFSSRTPPPPTPSSSAAASEPTPATVVLLQAPRSSHEHVRFASRSDQEFTSFDVNVHRETYDKAAISWNYLSYHQQPDKWQIRLENITPRKTSLFDSISTRRSRPERIQFVDAAVRRVELGVTLTAGNCYRVTVSALRGGSNLPHRVDNYCSIGVGETQFKAELTMDDLMALREKAKMYSQSSTVCHFLYRNKSPQYFSDMFSKDNGIMKGYVKDNSGDQASPINGQINGLFFMAEVQPGSTTGEPYSSSPFGSTRLIVPIHVMLELAPRLYFSDFYCMHGRFHYITLVMTRSGSTADHFCRQRLLPLSFDDHENNPFLFRRAGSGEMRVAQGIKVEVLFTENIDVNDFLRRRGARIVENVTLVGKGSSTPGGLPKNPTCPICNLRPPFQSGSDSF